MNRSMTLPPAWPTDSVPLSSLDLDPDNSRLMLRESLKNDELIARLVEQEEALDLAREIVRDGGLHPHETVVVVKKGRRYLVLEGNRRTAASLILLNPSILPSSQRGRIPDVSDALKDRLRTVRVVIAPNVAEAAPLVAALHTKRGKKPWSAAAKAFHLGRLADEGLTVHAIANGQKLSPGAVKKAILSHRLLGVATSTPGLTKEEKQHLSDPRLKLNPFTRFFGLKRASRLLNLGVDEKGHLTHDGLTSSEAKTVIRAIARDMLLPRAAGETPRFNTRVHEDTIIGHEIATKPEVAAILQKREIETNQSNPAPETVKGSPRIPKARPVKPSRPQEYFHGIEASGLRNNQPLANLVAEIAQFPIGTYPAAGIYLQRGLVEGCLMHAITEKKLRQDFHTAHTHRYGLLDLIIFSKARKTDLWREPDRIAGLLGKWESHFRFIADQTVHVIMAGNADTARQAAAIIRPLVEGILRNDALKL